MTAVGGAGQILVLDAMCLIHSARAERLDVLGELLVDRECWTTRVVLEELREGAAIHPTLDAVLNLGWLNIAELDTLDEIKLFAIWVQRLGSGERDLGEASVLAAAERRGGTAVIDDREAVKVARAHDAEVHGTLWVLAGACREGTD